MIRTSWFHGLAAGWRMALSLLKTLGITCRSGVFIRRLSQRGPYRERESSDFFLGFPVSHFGRQRKNLPHGQRERSLANDEISSGESYNGSSSIFSFSYSRSCSRVMLRCQSRPLSASNSCLFFFRLILPINLQLKLS